MLLSISILAVASALHTLASPISSPHVVHEKRAITRHIRGSRIPEDAIIPLRIGLKQSNLEHGYDKVMDVSDPRSPNYGKHWTLQQVRDFFAPPPEAVEAVKQWLVDSDIKPELIQVSEDRGWIGVDLPTAQAEHLLRAEYHEYYPGRDASVRIGCEEYSLPQHISQLVDYVKPGVNLSPPAQKRSIVHREIPETVQSSPVAASVDPVLQFCGSKMRPACVRGLYNIPLGTYNTSANKLAIAMFQNSHYYQPDLNAYYSVFEHRVPIDTHPVLIPIDGGEGSTENIDDTFHEADIDLEIAIPLVYPQTTTYYSVGDIHANDSRMSEEDTVISPLLDAIDGGFCTPTDHQQSVRGCDEAPIPRVLSVSWAASELVAYERGAARSCHQIMKLVLQGSTIVVASGDFGVALDSNLHADSHNENGCYSDNGSPDGGVFSPGFPAGCPYALVVGGTQLPVNGTLEDPEEVLNVPLTELALASTSAPFSSGGGFSNYFARPSYQDSDVKTYLRKHAPDYPSYEYDGSDLFSGQSKIGSNGGLYNRAGRGYPDVSANGAHLVIAFKDRALFSSGTSISAPVWASIITLINEELTHAGYPPVGFAQPLLYQNPDAFNDITLGSNGGCGTDGFPASPGWDPSTGLGTPNYPKLLKAFMDAAERAAARRKDSPKSS